MPGLRRPDVAVQGGGYAIARRTRGIPGDASAAPMPRIGPRERRGRRFRRRSATTQAEGLGCLPSISLNPTSHPPDSRPRILRLGRQPPAARHTRHEHEVDAGGRRVARGQRGGDVHRIARAKLVAPDDLRNVSCHSAGLDHHVGSLDSAKQLLQLPQRGVADGLGDLLLFALLEYGRGGFEEGEVRHDDATRRRVRDGSRDEPANPPFSRLDHKSLHEGRRIEEVVPHASPSRRRITVSLSSSPSTWKGSGSR